LDKLRVLFLCTGNSCRSQLAEALANNDRSSQWMAASAGIVPTGYVHPLALQVLEEIGIHHAGFSKPVEFFRNETFDLVVTVCDDASENCPVWLGKGQKMHLSFPDPAKVIGTPSEVLAAFRQVRDDIRSQIGALLDAFHRSA
jgi:arsenate reductase